MWKQKTVRNLILIRLIILYWEILMIIRLSPYWFNQSSALFFNLAAHTMALHFICVQGWYNCILFFNGNECNISEGIIFNKWQAIVFRDNVRFYLIQAFVDLRCAFKICWICSKLRFVCFHVLVNFQHLGSESSFLSGLIN